jgi:hypothetical protein
LRAVLTTDLAGALMALWGANALATATSANSAIRKACMVSNMCGLDRIEKRNQLICVQASSPSLPQATLQLDAIFCLRRPRVIFFPNRSKI